MRKLILTIVLISIFVGNVATAQTVPDSTYYKRVFYTGKVWGFLKYFHSEVAKGNINWDMKLMETLLSVKNNVSNQDFNNSILSLLDNAGEMAEPTAPAPEIPDSLKYNLDLNWLENSIFTDEVRAKLDTIKARFRPQSNYYVGEYFEGGNPKLTDTDAQFYAWGVNQYPDEQYRLLALFRYWNIINYFYPYKYIIDQNWDSTLVEFIPEIVNANDEMSFHLAFMQLVTRINDSHGGIYSKVINVTIRGMFYLPLTLKYIENETFITGIFEDTTELKIGDVVKRINGNDVYTLRDSLRKYAAGSNNSAIEREINDRLLRGQRNEIVQLLIENTEGQKEITLTRDYFIQNYLEDLIQKKGPIWKIIEADSGRFGYVDMGRLEVSHVDSMFNDLWETDAIIFDIRSYPNGTMWYMINYLFDEPIHNAKFTVPDIEYPGTLYWYSDHVGMGDFSKTYDKNIFILFNESTQSQAEYTVMALEQHSHAIKIGSQTSGADGNVSRIELPGGFITYFTGLGVFYPDGRETQRIGIIPDIEVHPTIAGIREGRDEVLEAALNCKPLGVDGKYLVNQAPIPGTYLFQNYPNPFNSSTRIRFQITEPGNMSVKIYNIIGQKIKTLVNEDREIGSYKISWDGRDDMGRNVSSGVYFIRLQTKNNIYTRKLLLVR